MKAFGWDVLEIDGHDVASLIDAYNTKTDKPLVIIANTIKGKVFRSWKIIGVSITQDFQLTV